MSLPAAALGVQEMHGSWRLTHLLPPHLYLPSTPFFIPFHRDLSPNMFFSLKRYSGVPLGERLQGNIIPDWREDYPFPTQSLQGASVISKDLGFFSL